MDPYSLPPLTLNEVLLALVVGIVVVLLGVRSARKANRQRTVSKHDGQSHLVK